MRVFGIARIGKDWEKDSTGSLIVFPTVEEAREWIDERELSNAVLKRKPIGFMIVSLNVEACSYPMICGGCEGWFPDFVSLSEHMERKGH